MTLYVLSLIVWQPYWNVFEGESNLIDSLLIKYKIQSNLIYCDFIISNCF